MLIKIRIRLSNNLEASFTARLLFLIGGTMFQSLQRHDESRNLFSFDMTANFDYSKVAENIEFKVKKRITEIQENYEGELEISKDEQELMDEGYLSRNVMVTIEIPKILMAIRFDKFSELGYTFKCSDICMQMIEVVNPILDYTSRTACKVNDDECDESDNSIITEYVTITVSDAMVVEDTPEVNMVRDLQTQIWNAESRKKSVFKMLKEIRRASKWQDQLKRADKVK